MHDYDALLEDLPVAHRWRAALRALMAAGPDCTSALRRGLRHPHPAVRVGCCIVLDHYLDPEAIPELIANLDHEHPRVRKWALHALACDRCKEGECRPGEEDTVPFAIEKLLNDPDRYVRKDAAMMLGPAVHRRPDALDALIRARDTDPDPLVRKVAGWYCPDGPIFQRTKPKPVRKPRPA